MYRKINELTSAYVKERKFVPYRAIQPKTFYLLFNRIDSIISTRLIFVITILLIPMVFYLSGCVFECDTTPPAVPRGVTSVTGDEKVTLYWHPNSEPDLEGYNIYFSYEPTGWYEYIATTKSAYYVDYDVVNGTTYYYAVTAFDIHGNESELSYELVFDTPRPAGTGVVLWDYNTYPNDAGFDFSHEMVQPYDRLSTDIYFEYHSESGGYYMNARDDATQIQDFGYTDTLDDIDWAPEDGWSELGWVEVIYGHTYIVWTRDNHFAKFRVTKLGGLSVTIDWAYQIDPGNPELIDGDTDSNEEPITQSSINNKTN